MKVLNRRELPEERLATTDEKGRRVYIFPEKVRGFFRKWRTATQIVLIIFFLVLPWVKINGYQALLLDLPNRRFSIFGLTFWAHDGPLIFYILAILTIGLALFTALFGRIWCGWGCPQTVFIDGVFRRIEYLIMGSHIKQMKLATGPWNSEKILKYALTWFLFALISMVISHSFLAYFTGAERLVDMTQHNPYQNWTVFLIMFFISAVLMFDFGWFREQFCIIMCPYGRIQSVLMDDDSITVSYDNVRGEPRRGTAKGGEHEGDCVDCFKCVSVCPTGIDIRRGLQMECVGCTACIDACDEVMEKVDKPRGLIRYASGNSLKGNPTKFFKSRTVLYSLVLIVISTLFVINVSSREDIMITVLRGKDSPYQIVHEDEQNEGDEYEDTGRIINHFKLHLKNQSFEDASLTMELPEDLAKKNIKLISQSDDIEIAAGKDTMVHLFIEFPEKLTIGTGNNSVNLLIIDNLTHSVKSTKELKLIGPRSAS